FDRQVQYGFEVPEQLRERPGMEELLELMPAANYSSMLLLFNESASLMTPAPTPEEEVLDAMSLRAQGLATRMKMGSSSRSDQEVLLEAYVRYEDGAVAETRELMTRKFLITGTRPAYEWRLTGEQSELLGYVVHKATAVHDSSHIEAWFTPEIPVSAGPGLFGGLPGMILALSVDDGQTVYSATEVKLDPVDAAVIKAPEDGEEVSPEEYEEIVAEKLEEIRMRRRRGDRRGQ
ncbi:MAG: GLPGLI family protein, partial [Gemmatimonadetes bacterium]|nr:GLPGLI family protein [Gemmatimonadota bacterium]